MKFYLKLLLLIIFLSILVCAGFYYAEVMRAPTSKDARQSSSVCIKGRCFQVELAENELQRGRGLMYRTELGEDRGMLFIFDKEDFYPFWMKNTLIPLDIIWIDSNRKVVFMAQKVQPCRVLICPSVLPTANAKYVLEINSGICQEISLKLGDRVVINTY